MQPDDPARYQQALDVLLRRVEEVMDSMPAITFTSDGILTTVVPLPSPLEGGVASPLLGRLRQVLNARGFTFAYTTGATSFTLTRTTVAGETVGGTLAHCSDGPSDDNLHKHVQAGTVLSTLLGTLDVALYEGWTRTEILGALAFVFAVVRGIQQIYDDK